MPKVRLHRTNLEPLLIGAVNTEHGSQCLYFNRIAKRGSRAMRFDVADKPRVNVCVCQRSSNDSLLRQPIGCGQAAAASILVDGGPADHCKDLVSIGNRVGETFEHNHAASFRAYKPISAGVEGFAAPIVGDHARS